MSIATWEFESPPLHLFAEIAQLVEHNLAKVGVASSSLVFRSLSNRQEPKVPADSRLCVDAKESVRIACAICPALRFLASICKVVAVRVFSGGIHVFSQVCNHSTLSALQSCFPHLSACHYGKPVEMSGLW